MSLSSEAHAFDPEIQSATKHARIAQAEECVKMIRWMMKNPPNRNAASMRTLEDAETHLMAGVQRLKNGEQFWSSTTKVGMEELERVNCFHCARPFADTTQMIIAWRQEFGNRVLCPACRDDISSGLLKKEEIYGRTDAQTKTQQTPPSSR
jgi:hypothetical protein